MAAITPLPTRGRPFNSGVYSTMSGRATKIANTEAALDRTPLLGQVVDGWNKIAWGLGESGAVGFGQEMVEGGYYLAEETAGRAVDYLRSFW